MKLLVLIALLCTTSCLVVIESACVTAVCQNALMEYMLRLNSNSKCEKEGDDIITSVSHTLPPAGTSGLSVNAYTVNKNNDALKYSITNFVRKDVDGLMYLRMLFTFDSVRSNQGCYDVGTDKFFYQYQCKLALEYINHPQGGLIKKYSYQMSVKVPRTLQGDYVLGSGPILERGCDCEINLELQALTYIYKDEGCTKLLGTNEELVYGSYVCLELRGNDAVSKNQKLTITNVKTTYEDSMKNQVTLDLTDIAIRRCSLANICETGRAYASFRLFNVGTLQFSVIATLSDLRRILADGEESLPMGMQATFAQKVTVVEPSEDGSSIVTDYASSVIVSIATLLALLMVIL